MFCKRDDQAVAAERGDEPRQSGGGDEHHVIGALDRQAQRRHIIDRLMIELMEVVIRAC